MLEMGAFFFPFELYGYLHAESDGHRGEICGRQYVVGQKESVGFDH